MACKIKKYADGGEIDPITGKPVKKNSWDNQETWSSLGTALGTGIGAIFGAPQIGSQVGSAVGSLGYGIYGMTANNRPKGLGISSTSIIPTNQNMTQGYNPQLSSQMYANGGILNNITNYNGPKHEQGGVSIGEGQEVEGGEVRVGNFIFSNRIRIPQSNSSFADEAKKIQNKYKSYNNDSISNTSMERELAQLAKAQENIKAKEQYLSNLQNTQNFENIDETERYDLGGPYKNYKGQLNSLSSMQPIPPDINVTNDNPNDLNFRQKLSSTMRYLGLKPSPTSFGDVYANTGIGPLMNKINMNQYTRQTRRENRNNNTPSTFTPEEVQQKNNIFQSSPHYKGMMEINNYLKRFEPGHPIRQELEKMYDDTLNQIISDPKQRSISDDVLYNDLMLRYKLLYKDNPMGPQEQIKNPTFIGPSEEEENNTQYKNGGIYIKPENRGKFTQWTENHNMSVQEAASKIMSNKENYSSTLVKRANFAKNAKKWYDGGTMDIPPVNGTNTDINWWNAYLNDQPYTYNNDAGYSNTVLPNGSRSQSRIYTEPITFSNNQNNNNNNNNNNYIPLKRKDIDEVIVKGTGTAYKDIPKLVNLDGRITIPPYKVQNNNINTSGNNVSEELVSGEGTDNPNLKIKVKDWLKGLGINDKKINEYLKGNNDITLSDLIKTGASTLGGLYDIARGLSGGNYEVYGRIPNINLNKLDPTEAIRQVRELTSSSADKIKGIGGQGISGYLNNINSLYNNAQKNIGQIVSQYDNANMGITNQERQLNNEILQKNLQLDMAQNDINARERDTARNTLQYGLTALGQGLNQQFADQAMRRSENVALKLLETADYGTIKDSNGELLTVRKLTGTDGNKYVVDADNNVYDSNRRLIGKITDENVINLFTVKK